jgi:hypothetical protein
VSAAGEGEQAARLFDLALARRLLALPRAELLGWLDERLPELKATTRRGAAALLEVLAARLPAEEAAALPPPGFFEGHWDDLRLALAEAGDEAEVRLAAAAIAEKAAFGEERVELELAGGALRALGGTPAGALTDGDLFASDGPVRYLLLLPDQGRRLAAALPPDGAEALAAMCQRCGARAGLRLAVLL